MSDWQKSLQAGDEVVYTDQFGTQSIVKVESVTKSGWVGIRGMTFGLNGLERGGPKTRGYGVSTRKIEPATGDLRAKIELREARRELSRNLGSLNVHKLSADGVRVLSSAVNAILEEGLYE